MKKTASLCWPETAPAQARSGFVKNSKGIPFQRGCPCFFLCIRGMIQKRKAGAFRRLPNGAAGSFCKASGRNMCMIVPVTGENLREAAEVYAHGWRASHEAFCTQEFLSQHTDLYQMQYLEEELQKGKRFFLLHMPEPVGIVSVHGPMLEHLYVLPQAGGTGLAPSFCVLHWRRAHICCGCWTTTAGPSPGMKAGALPLPGAQTGFPHAARAGNGPARPARCAGR